MKVKSQGRKEFAVSCDWLQIHVKHKDNFLVQNASTCHFIRTGQSKVFKDIYNVIETITGKVVAVYCTNANECIMEARNGILKIDNQQLYINQDLKGWVQNLLYEIDFEFKSITRFDMALDMQSFANDLDPESFIKRYSNNELLLVTHAPHKDGIYFESFKNKKIFETLSIGSKRKRVGIKLYNKSRELKGNEKPWIRALHKENFKDRSKDIWRLEFSLLSLKAFMKSAGDDESINNLDILDIDKMYGLYIGIFRKYFRFRINDPKQKRLDRMDSIWLWDFELSGLEIETVMKNPVLKSSSRSEKIFIKKMDQFNREFRLFDENFSYTAKEMVSKIIDMHDLGEWARDNNIDFDPGCNYANDINDFQVILKTDFLEKKHNEALMNGKMYDQKMNIYAPSGNDPRIQKNIL